MENLSPSQVEKAVEAIGFLSSLSDSLPGPSTSSTTPSEGSRACGGSGGIAGSRARLAGQNSMLKGLVYTSMTYVFVLVAS